MENPDTPRECFPHAAADTATVAALECLVNESTAGLWAVH